VLRLMAEGVASREIAKKLGISYTDSADAHTNLAASSVHSKLEAIVQGPANWPSSNEPRRPHAD